MYDRNPLAETRLGHERIFCGTLCDMDQGNIIKTFKSKKGNDVVIRYPTAADLDAMLSYANNLIAEDTFIQLSGKKKTREEEKKYLDELLEQIQNGKKAELVVWVNGKYAGSGKVRRQEFRKQHVGELGISIAREYRDEGIGSKLFALLIEEGKKMGLKLLYLHCFEGNDRAIHMYKKFGFKPAGLLPGAIEYQGTYIGEITMYLPIHP